jgi:hypothetical protein
MINEKHLVQVKNFEEVTFWGISLQKIWELEKSKLLKIPNVEVLKP